MYLKGLVLQTEKKTHTQISCHRQGRQEQKATESVGKLILDLHISNITNSRTHAEHGAVKYFEPALFENAYSKIVRLLRKGFPKVIVCCSAIFLK